jgi:hypothetical protein
VIAPDMTRFNRSARDVVKQTVVGRAAGPDAEAARALEPEDRRAGGIDDRDRGAVVLEPLLQRLGDAEYPRAAEDDDVGAYALAEVGETSA